MSKYQHIFFDLDHTLWDFKGNSRRTLSELFSHFDIQSKTDNTVDDFLDVYERYNQKMWNDYCSGRMSLSTLRTERFRQSFRHIGVRDGVVIKEVADYFVSHGPRKKGLFPNAIEVLTYLKSKYPLHIITNGFEEVQLIKLESSGLAPFFNEIITSERAGSKKPHPGIFQYSLEVTKAKASDCLMIGDNEQIDVLGARRAGMDGVYFNPENHDAVTNPTHEIRDLKELLKFL